MDAFTIKLSFNNPSCFKTTSHPCFPAPLSFFKFAHFDKLRTSSLINTCCLKEGKSSDPQMPNNHTRNFPINPLRVFYPILRSIKGLAAISQTKKWASRFPAHSSQLDDDDNNNNSSNSSITEQDGNTFLHNGAFGAAILSVTSTAKVKISPFVATLAANPTFVSGFFAWMLAQSTKVFLNFFVERKWDLRLLFASGGMPSSHSALCTALTTSVALCHGVADSLFPVCLGFSLIVMYDAIGVRRHAGMQAQVLNMIVEDLFQGHPISQRKLKELLGHSPSQVFAGAMLGIIVAFFCCQSCLVAT